MGERGISNGKEAGLMNRAKAKRTHTQIEKKGRTVRGFFIGLCIPDPGLAIPTPAPTGKPIPGVPGVPPPGSPARLAAPTAVSSSSSLFFPRFASASALPGRATGVPGRPPPCGGPGPGPCGRGVPTPIDAGVWGRRIPA